MSRKVEDMRMELVLVVLTLAMVTFPSCASLEEVQVASSSPSKVETLPLGDAAQMTRLQGRDEQAVPKVEIISPRDGEILDSSNVGIRLKLSNYSISRASGRHVHVVVDDRPYMAHYEEDGITVIDAEDLGAGTHTIVAFPAHPFHLSIKGESSFDTCTFHVKYSDGRHALKPDSPALIYSRPKGTYTGIGAKNIMLDFYLLNTTLADDGHRVRVLLDGEEADVLDEWEPIILLREPKPRTYEVTLELIDEEGELVPGAFNPTSRVITVE